MNANATIIFDIILGNFVIICVSSCQCIHRVRIILLTVFIITSFNHLHMYISTCSQLIIHSWWQLESIRVKMLFVDF